MSDNTQTLIPAQTVVKTFIESIFIPEHNPRKKNSSSVFRRAKKKLKADGNWRCFVCGKKTDLSAHHIVPWSQANNVDFAKLQNFLLVFDPYGYNQAMKDVPILSIDDIRNLMTLCSGHHQSENTNDDQGGIHSMSAVGWILQIVRKDFFPPEEKESEVKDAKLQRRDCGGALADQARSAGRGRGAKRRTRRN